MRPWLFWSRRGLWDWLLNFHLPDLGLAQSFYRDWQADLALGESKMGAGQAKSSGDGWPLHMPPGTLWHPGPLTCCILA